MITVSKEILMHPDFDNNFADKLCELLESFMDEIFESDEEIDFDFIDECASVINAIRCGDTAQILPVISRKNFFKKLHIRTHNNFRNSAIAAAAAVLVLIAGTQIKNNENVSLIRYFSGVVSELFRGEQKTENTTSDPEVIITEEKTTESTGETEPEDITEKMPAVSGINIVTTSDFRTEYYVGEKFSSKGIKVFAEYANGERKSLPVINYTVEVSDDFGTEAKYEKVVIKSNGFAEVLTVRVIENISTKKLNSVYAVFPDGFDFTAEDLDNFRCDEMRVFAQYSDGSEKELKNNEYTVSYEHRKTLFNEQLNVTVEYENCFCSFAVSKK